MAVSCDGHRPYRSKREAQYVLGWHLHTLCRKCRRGLYWRVWEHQGHWHVGHGRWPA